MRSKDLWTWPNLPAYLVLQLFEHEGHRAAVEVSWRRGHWSVNVCVGINPDKTQVRTLLGVASHRPNGQAWGEIDRGPSESGNHLKDFARYDVATCGHPLAWPACGQLQLLCLWPQPASYWRRQRCEESSHPWTGRPSRCGGNWGHQSHGRSSLRRSRGSSGEFGALLRWAAAGVAIISHPFYNYPAWEEKIFQDLRCNCLKEFEPAPEEHLWRGHFPLVFPGQIGFPLERVGSKQVVPSTSLGVHLATWPLMAVSHYVCCSQGHEATRPITILRLDRNSILLHLMQYQFT